MCIAHRQIVELDGNLLQLVTPALLERFLEHTLHNGHYSNAQQMKRMQRRLLFKRNRRIEKRIETIRKGRARFIGKREAHRLWEATAQQSRRFQDAGADAA
jgi:hypothetical protein